MDVLLPAEQQARLAVVEQARLIDVKDACWLEPKPFIAEINAFDPTTLDHFHFSMYSPESDPFWPYEQPRADEGWLWQGDIIDWWMSPDVRKFLILKARQLGVTWLGMAVSLWHLLFKPGSHSVCYSYTLDEAQKLIVRAWLMYNSLPEYLRSHVTVTTPQRGEPTEWIRVVHRESGLISTIQALPATQKAGHGETVTWGFSDEVARQDYGKQIYTALNPAASRGGRVVFCSTANGVGNPETGEGNYFHILYVTQKEKGLSFRFLPWNLEPTRDQAWYDVEAMALDEVERNQQYPLNENDAFMLSGANYFDRDSLAWYRRNTVKPLFSGNFTQRGREAEFLRLADGIIEVYEKPIEGHDYAMGVDTATGRADDYTVANVIDLESGTICAEMRAKIEAPQAAIQIFFLGQWYNKAKIAVERQGGYGEALITFLRDGTKSLPPYTNMYRHTTFTRAGKPLSEEFGIPMGPSNRPLVLENLADWIRTRGFPFLGTGHVDELGTFVRVSKGPSPAAQEGTHDDRVMSLAITVFMFSQFGHFADSKKRKWKPRPYMPSPVRS